jgi:hypothetical protein
MATGRQSTLHAPPLAPRPRLSRHGLSLLDRHRPTRSTRALRAALPRKRQSQPDGRSVAALHPAAAPAPAVTGRRPVDARHGRRRGAVIVRDVAEAIPADVGGRAVPEPALRAGAPCPVGLARLRRVVLKRVRIRRAGPATAPGAPCHRAWVATGPSALRFAAAARAVGSATAAHFGHAARAAVERPAAAIRRAPAREPDVGARRRRTTALIARAAAAAGLRSGAASTVERAAAAVGDGAASRALGRARGRRTSALVAGAAAAASLVRGAGSAVERRAAAVRNAPAGSALRGARGGDAARVRTVGRAGLLRPDFATSSFRIGFCVHRFVPRVAGARPRVARRVAAAASAPRRELPATHARALPTPAAGHRRARVRARTTPGRRVGGAPRGSPVPSSEPKVAPVPLRRQRRFIAPSRAPVGVVVRGAAPFVRATTDHRTQPQQRDRAQSDWVPHSTREQQATCPSLRLRKQARVSVRGRPPRVARSSAGLGKIQLRWCHRGDGVAGILEKEAQWSDRRRSGRRRSPCASAIALTPIDCYGVRPRGSDESKGDRRDPSVIVWIIIADDGGSSTNVDVYDPSTGSVTVVLKSIGFEGDVSSTSTCVPTTAPK